MQYTYTFLAKDLLSSKLNKIASNTSSKLQDVAKKNDQFNRGLDRTKTQSEKTSRSLGGLNNVLGSLGVAFGAMAIGNKIKDIVMLGSEMEGTRVAFEVMLGSAEKANKTIAKLNEFSNVTPFQNKEVIAAGRNLIAFGTTTEELEPTLKNLGNVAAGLKIPFNELADIYGKNRVQGKIFTEDLNQLGGRGIPIFEELGKIMGVTSAEIRTMASKGQLDFKHLEKAFKNMSDPGGKFNGMMEKMSETFGGKLSTFMGKFVDKMTKLGEKITPKLKPLLDWAINLIDRLPVLASEFQQMATPAINSLMGLYNSLKQLFTALFQGSISVSFFKDLLQGALNVVSFFAGGISWIIKGITKMSGVLKWSFGIIAGFIALFKIINIVMTANPVGAVIVGIVALISAIKYAWDNFESFRGGVMAAWEAIKGFAGLIKDVVINRIKEMMNGLIGIGKSLWKLMKGDFKGALGEGKKAMENMMGFSSVDLAVKKAKEIGYNSAKAYNKGVNQVKNKNKLTEIEAAASTGTNLDNAETIKAQGGDALGGASGLGVKNGINSITGGGSKQTNIMVNFDKLNENINITTQNFKEGVSVAEDQLKEMLLRVLNSSNQLQTS